MIVKQMQIRLPMIILKKDAFLFAAKKAEMENCKMHIGYILKIWLSPLQDTTKIKKNKNVLNFYSSHLILLKVLKNKMNFEQIYSEKEIIIFIF